MNKKVLIGISAVVLVLAVVIWQLLSNLDSIVASMIEDTGSDVLQTRVRVSGVSVDLKQGKAGIANLSVDNPEGYSAAKLFEADGIEIELELKSLASDVLIIEAIRIRNPRIRFEGDASGGSNMQTLLDNIESGSSGDGEQAEAEATKMIIDFLEFSGAELRATSDLKPDEVLEIKLDRIKMSDIGRAEGGVTADVVAEEVTVELVSAIITAVVRASATRAIEDKAKSIWDKLKGKG